MKKEDIQITDIYRILNGQVPLEFYIELILRTLFVFLVLTFGMKYLGKRQSSQLSRSELAATSTLAAATGLVILAPDRGLVPPLIIVGIIILIQRYVHKRGMHSGYFESMTEGHLSLLVSEGIMDLKSMKEARVSHEQLFAELRGMDIQQLGEIKRLYLEANGEFSIIRSPQAKPGLPVIPDWDQDFFEDHASVEVCSQCGSERRDSAKICKHCEGTAWQRAVSS